MKSSPLPLIAQGNTPAALSVVPQHNGSIAHIFAALRISYLVGSACAYGFWCVNAFVMSTPVSAKSLLSVSLLLLSLWRGSRPACWRLVQALGLATGGMLGARLAERLGIKTSWMTVLRRIMALPSEPVQQVVELGIDDFAFRRGRIYGTILVDMRSHKVIDVLPDRSAETSAAWMATHPEIETGRVEIVEGTMHQQRRLPLPRPSNVRTDFISSCAV
jgi:hypothetical protein